MIVMFAQILHVIHVLVGIQSKTIETHEIRILELYKATQTLGTTQIPKPTQTLETKISLHRHEAITLDLSEVQVETPVQAAVM